MFAAPLPDEPAREALRQAASALDAAQARGHALEISQALVAVARAYRTLRASRSAEVTFSLALRWARAAACTDAVVDTLCELCETAADLATALETERRGSGHAARERARDHAFEASTLAPHVADPDWEVKVLLRISDVLDRCGDREDAVQLQARALRLMAGGVHARVANPGLLPSLGRLADQ